ncbi:MAG: hypothetical protein IIB38_02715 [Candidatus Hydrogenedentes bacterium]|nr:hypothetical protein [Candidatus Hydrogenedentota bacterium]
MVTRRGFLKTTVGTTVGASLGRVAVAQNAAPGEGAESLRMPKVPFGPHTISRLIAGGNQQAGASHQSVLMTQHMLDYFTVDQTVAFLRSCIAQGINTWQANYNEKTRDAVLRIREGGEEINLISLASPHFDENALAKTLELNPIGIYLFGWTSDQLYHAGKLDTARDFLKKIRDTGVQVGFGAHRPEVIEYAEEKGWDIDFYMTSLYRWGRSREEILEILPEVPHDDGYGGMELYLPSELPRMCDTIRKVTKPCLAFKLMAGGRTCKTPQQVSDVFEYVLGRIKPTDAVLVGMYPRFSDEIKANADFARKFA